MNDKTLLRVSIGLAVIVGTWAIWRFLDELQAGAKEFTDRTIAKPIADLIVGEREIRVLGNVVLPTGKRIPIDGLRLMPNAEFDHGGVRYRLTKRRIDNDYDSIRIM